MTQPSSATETRPRVGLVVGSGGLKCAAALGLWRVLDREGIDLDLVVGCSGGSIYATLMGRGWKAETAIGRHALRDDMFRKKRRRSFLQIMMPNLFRFDARRFGILDDGPINAIIDAAAEDLTFDQMKVPLHIVATDVLTGGKVTLSSGRVSDAVRASIAMPFVLSPREIDGQLLIDGGASDPLPIDVAIKEGAEIIIAMGFENPIVPAIDTAVRMILQTTAITMNHLLRSTFAFYSMAHHAEVIPVMPTFERPIGLNDVHLLPYIIEQGEAAAERELPYLKRLLAKPASVA